MELKTLYICAEKGMKHVTDKQSEFGTCPDCAANKFNFLIKVLDSSPIWKEVKEAFEEKIKPKNKNENFEKYILEGDRLLTKHSYEDAIQKYSNALNLNIDNKLANEKLLTAKLKWEGFRPPPPPPPSAPLAGNNEYGLCILLMDASGSMEQRPFEGSAYTKKQLIAKTAAHGIFDMKDNRKAKDAYMIIYQFDNSIKPLIPLSSLQGIIDHYKIPENLELEILSKLESMQGTTDINGALQVAYQNAKDFVAGDYKGLFGNDYNVMMHAVTDSVKNKNIQVPNVRVFLYTDGLQYINGKSDALVNPFNVVKDFNVDILMGGYFGKEINRDTGKQSEGCSELKESLGTCPEHGVKNYFLFDSPEKMGTLRNLFKMASGASGFCPECLKREDRPEEYVEKDRVN